MITTNTGFDNQAATGIYTTANIVQMDFVIGGVVTPLYLAAYARNIVAFDNIFVGTNKISVGPLKESEDGNSQQVEIMLNPLKESLLQYAMGEVSSYQDRRIQIWLALLDPATGRLAGTPIRRFVGAMATTSVDRNGDKSSVKLVSRSGSYAQTNDPESLRYTDAQQQREYPGDVGMNQIVGIIAKPRAWLTERYQRI